MENNEHKSRGAKIKSIGYDKFIHLNPLTIYRRSLEEEDITLLREWVGVVYSHHAANTSVNTTLRINMDEDQYFELWENYGRLLSGVYSLCRSRILEEESVGGFKPYEWEKIYHSMQEAAWAYLSSFLTDIEYWITPWGGKVEENPLISGAKLWERGLIPSFGPYRSYVLGGIDGFFVAGNDFFKSLPYALDMREKIDAVQAKIRERYNLTDKPE